MAEHSTIEWTDATWNPITGCALVSEGCRHCYAARLAATRLKHLPSRRGLARLNAAGEAKFTGQVRFNEDWLDQPLRWRRPRRIFVCAHGDLFAENVPDEWIDRVFAVMALAPQHTFQVLTKRPERMRDYIVSLAGRGDWGSWLAAEIVGNGPDMTRPRARLERTCDLIGRTDWPLPNVWLGTSVEDQATADARIPALLDTPAAARFLSAEPLLGPVDLTRIRFRNDRGGEEDWNALDEDAHCSGCGAPWAGIDCCYAPSRATSRRLDWIIAGGESGPGARPMHPAWARALRDQCAAAGVPFFFKQWGEWMPASELGLEQPSFERVTVLPDGQVREWADGYPDVRLVHDRMRPMARTGKTRAGRLLDGRTHDEMPEPAR